MKLAIIGGSLLKEFDGFTKVTEERINTPFGTPSDNFVTGNIRDFTSEVSRLDIFNDFSSRVENLIADDQGIVEDMPSWCKITGQEFLGIENGEDEYKAYVKKIV